MQSVIVYSNEEKYRAHERMKNDPHVEFFNAQINLINELWSYPQIIKIGDNLISNEIPNMPVEVQALIDEFKKDREDYIKSSYPELVSL